MTADPRLESYLTSLEQVLRPFPVSDRAEIVTEIKSHVLSTLERDPQTRLDTVLAALGEPETVANRYLIERGLQPTKPPISPIVKWIVIGFLGTFAMLLIFVGVVIMRFSPLLHVDDLKNKVSLLGGMIEVDGKDGKILISGKMSDGQSGSFEGMAAISAGQAVSVKFGNGQINVANADEAKLSWTCSGRGGQSVPAPVTEGGEVKLDLTSIPWVKCDVAVPENVKLAISGSNGKIELDEPHYNLAADLTNGKVDIEPDADKSYKYQLAVANGKTDSFESSGKADAYSIAVHVTNGKISQGK